jgi:hypothetical protein
VGVKKYGDWKTALRIVNTMQSRFEQAADQAALEEGHFLRKELVQGMTSGAPGGKQLAALAPTTLAVRAATGFKGTKPLLRRGDLRAAIVVKKESGVVFVGILKGAKSKAGKPIANIADMMEHGSRPIVIRLSDKARKFLMMAFRRAGIVGTGGHHDTKGTMIVIVQIPARPVFAPVFEKYLADREAVARRFLGRIAKRLGGDLGVVS